MFHIVDFVVNEADASKDETEVVPAAWVQDKRSYWPPYPRRGQCELAVRRSITPIDTWHIYDLRKIRGTRGMIHFNVTKKD